MIYRTMIVTASHVDAARALAALYPDSTNYSVALSATGLEPTTHWGGAGAVNDDFAAALDDPQIVADVMGTSLAEATDLLAHMITSGDDVWTVLPREGLKIVVPDEPI